MSEFPDLRPPMTVPEPVVAALQAELELAAAKISLSLTATVRRPCRLEVLSVEAVNDLPGTEAAWFKVGPAVGRAAALVFDTAAVRQLAEVFMGGPGADAGGAPTTLERQIVAKRLTAGLASLSPILAEANVTGCDIAPVVDPAEVGLDAVVLRASLDLSLGDVETAVSLLVPAGQHAIARKPAAAEPSPAVMSALSEIPVAVAVRFEPIQVAASDLDELAVGDVIRLDQSVDAEVVGDVEGRPMFRGRVGRRGRKLALEIRTVSQ